jgi:hypothetical protein
MRGQNASTWIVGSQYGRSSHTDCWYMIALLVVMRRFTVLPVSGITGNGLQSQSTRLHSKQSAIRYVKPEAVFDYVSPVH